MNKLEEARLLIDEADSLIREGFVKRMQASKLVALYKKENNLPIYDKKREGIVIANNLAKLNDSNLEKHYEKLLKALIDISKDYQKDLIDE